MPAAAITAVAAVGGAVISSSASKKAAKTVANATDQAAHLEHQRYLELKELQMPAYERGEQAAKVYSALLGVDGMHNTVANGMTGGNAYDQAQPYMSHPQQSALQRDLQTQIFNTPGYQVQLDQGIKSIDRAAPLTGGMYSGRRMKALNDHGQNTFGGYYQDHMNRLGGLSGEASQVAANVGQAGMDNASNVGNLMVTGATHQAQAQLNSAKAWNSALGTAAGTIGGYYK